MATFTIPEYITVHLGPPNSNAQNITVPFRDYIKNVASSEIYPTWPESALRANILAQTTYALNRIYTEWYRSQGYDFDITNSTAYDQAFVPDRDIFGNISQIVDEIFNDYVVRQGSVAPYFTQYCSGALRQCEGLSQWGTVDLAEQGYVPYEILQYYYGDDINIVFGAPSAPNIRSYPGIPLKLGSAGEDVRTIQRQLNRIGDNYPAIPKIEVVNGIFTPETEAAVRKFQQIFNLTVDGIVGEATWYKIKYLYVTVKRLSELETEGVALSEVSRLYPGQLVLGDVGNHVRVLRYYLGVIGYFDPEIPVISLGDTFDQQTADVVRAFQQQKGLPVTGEVDRDTWNAILLAYADVRSSLPEAFSYSDFIYPGRILSPGISDWDVRVLQQMLSVITEANPNMPQVSVTGTYDQATEDAIRQIQEQYGIPVTGQTGAITWNAVVEEYLRVAG